MPRHGCLHNHPLQQTHYDSFECRDCGMWFFGIDRSNPRFQDAQDSITSNGGLINPDIYIGSIDPHSGRPSSHFQPTHVQVNLGTIPQDIIDTKNQLKEMEKALSMFAEILKNALQS